MNRFYYRRPIIHEEKTVDGEKKIFIVGNAVEVGTSRNKVNYSESELRTAAQTLIGRPMLLNHGDEDVRNIVGKIVDAKYENGNVPFKAELDSDEKSLISKIRKGFINSVSIGADYDSIHEDEDGIKHPVGLKFEELSLVTIPGVPNATISQVLEEKFNLMEEGKKMEDVEKLKSELETMRKENEELKARNEEILGQITSEPVEEKKDDSKVKELEKSIAELSKKIEENKGIVDVPEKKEKGKFEMVHEKDDGNKTVFYAKSWKELY